MGRWHLRMPLYEATGHPWVKLAKVKSVANIARLLGPLHGLGQCGEGVADSLAEVRMTAALLEGHRS